MVGHPKQRKSEEQLNAGISMTSLKGNNGKQIKVLYLIDHLIGFAGTEKQLYEIVSRLDKQVYSCAILSFSTPPTPTSNSALYRGYVSLIRKFQEAGILMKNIPIERIYGLRTIRSFAKLVREIREFKPDVVQTFHFISDTLGVTASFLAGVENIVSAKRDTGFQRKSRHLILNRACNPLLKGHIAVSEAVARSVGAREHVKMSKIKVVHNGINVEEFSGRDPRGDGVRRELGLSPGAFVVGIVSVFRPEKALDVFFRGMAILRSRNENIMVLAVGGGKMMSEMVDLCGTLGIRNNVIFTGYVSNAKRYISAMDVACLTSNTEGLSNVILEEMAMGKPVVATHVGGNPELIVDGITGRLVPKGRPEELAEAVWELYMKPDLRMQMGERGRDRVAKNFSMLNMMQKMEDLYASLKRESAIRKNGASARTM